MDEAALRAIEDWLMRFGIEAPGFEGLIEGLATRLRAAGVPMSRAMVGADSLHPTIGGESLRWEEGKGARIYAYERGREGMALSPGIMDEWLKSPIYHLVQTQCLEMRRRLDAGYLPGEFPLLDQLKDQGVTDYVAMLTHFPAGSTLGETDGLAATFASSDPGGFGEDHLAALRRLMPATALAFKALWLLRTSRALMATYLGADAAERVLEGRIGRGQAETIETVIWFSDLEHFTRLADTLPREQLMALLNDYAGAIVEAVGARGGQVLKLIGDGILAIFRDAPAEDACCRALDAATAALAACMQLSEHRQAAGLPATSCYIGLHRGEVLYGNVGSADRLDFTVLGPAVNETSRLERMCRSLDQRIVISSALAATAGPQGRRLVSLGRYLLRGVARPQELFTLDPELAAPDAE